MALNKGFCLSEPRCPHLPKGAGATCPAASAGYSPLPSSPHLQGGEGLQGGDKLVLHEGGALLGPSQAQVSVGAASAEAWAAPTACPTPASPAICSAGSSRARVDGECSGTIERDQCPGGCVGRAPPPSTPHHCHSPLGEGRDTRAGGRGGVVGLGSPGIPLPGTPASNLLHGLTRVKPKRAGVEVSLCPPYS